MKKLLTFLILFILIGPTQAQIISTIAGNGIEGFSGDYGQSSTAQIASPSDVVVDKAGNIYIADRNNSRVRKINTSGIITTIAGDGTVGFSGDSGLATLAQLGRPTGITLDSTGNIYILDRDNNRIRKISTSGIITTIAGNGSAGYTGDGGDATQAKFGNGFGISSDKIGEIYIADFENQVIRKVNTSGVISTVAGNGIAGNFGDGGLAINAQLNYPNWVAVDNIGNIFISDMNNNKIRKVNTSGIISTFAGAASGSSGYSGDGGLATYALLSLPQGIAIDSIGNVYISDSGNDRIRLIDTSGIISTYAGNGTPGYSGDGGLATYANIGGRSGICVDNKRNLYLADAFTNRIRKVTFENTSVEQTESDNHLINVYPNPTSNELTIDFALTEKSYFELYDIFGAKRKEVTLVSSKQSEKINLSDIDSGLYFYSVFDRKENNIKTGKLIIIK